MNYMTSLKYQLNEYKKALMIYYPIVIALFIIGTILYRTLPGVSVNMGGIESATVIFLLIMGLNSFRESSRMMLQNGVSRTTQFKAIISGIVSLSLIMLVIDSLGRLVFSQFIPYVPELEEMFLGGYPTAGRFTVVTGVLLCQFGLYAGICLIGLAINTLYLRMNKGFKIAVSITVPVFFFVAAPILTEVFNIRIFKPLTDFFNMIFGINPYLDAVLLLAGGVLLSGIIYLMMRKANFEH